MLGGLRARLDDDPILVVPSFQDVEHAQRELDERGAVFGALVLRFEWLYREIARRAGTGDRVASEVQRQLLLEATVRAGRSARARRVGRPAGLRARGGPLRGGAGPRQGRPRPLHPGAAGMGRRRARRGYADEVAAIYGGYRRALEQAGLVDPELFAWRALDAPAARARRAGAARRCSSTASTTSPSSSSTRSRRWPPAADAHVCVSLPFEPGREAFRATAGVHARLSEIATDRIELAAVDDHYAPGSRAALHQVERGLFESDPPPPVEAGRRDRLPLGGRRARRGGAGGGAGARPAARRHRAGRRGGGVPRSHALRVARGAGVRGLRRALLARPRAPLRPHRPRPRPARADPLRASRRQRRRPAGLPAHAGHPEAAGARGPARGAGAPGRRAQRGAGARPLGARALDRRRTSSASRAPATRARTWTSSRPCSARLFAAPYKRRARRCSPAPSSTTRACSAPARRR